MYRCGWRCVGATRSSEHACAIHVVGTASAWLTGPSLPTGGGKLSHPGRRDAPGGDPHNGGGCEVACVAGWVGRG